MKLDNIMVFNVKIHDFPQSISNKLKSVNMDTEYMCLIYN
jgi:hypothetical protein